MNDFFNNQSKTKVEMAMGFFNKYCKGMMDTVDFNKNAGWCPESEVIIYEEILPKVELLSTSIAKLTHAEEQAAIDRQLTEKPVDNITVESQDNMFVIKDTTTGETIGSGDGKLVKENLEVMYKMQKRNAQTVKAEAETEIKVQPQPQEKEFSLPNSNDKAPF